MDYCRLDSGLAQSTQRSSVGGSPPNWFEGIWVVWETMRKSTVEANGIIYLFGACIYEISKHERGINYKGRPMIPWCLHRTQPSSLWPRSLIRCFKQPIVLELKYCRMPLLFLFLLCFATPANHKGTPKHSCRCWLGHCCCCCCSIAFCFSFCLLSFVLFLWLSLSLSSWSLLSSRFVSSEGRGATYLTRHGTVP